MHIANPLLTTAQFLVNRAWTRMRKLILVQPYATEMISSVSFILWGNTFLAPGTQWPRMMDALNQPEAMLAAYGIVVGSFQGTGLLLGGVSYRRALAMVAFLAWLFITLCLVLVFHQLTPTAALMLVLAIGNGWAYAQIPITGDFND